MSFKNFFNILIMFSLFAGASFAKIENREKARQAELERLKKRESAFIALKEKRDQRQRQRQEIQQSAEDLEQVIPYIQYTLHQAEQFKLAQMSEGFSEKPLAYGIIIKFKESIHPPPPEKYR